MVMVPKKDGTMWLCIDFRKVNSLVCFDADPMPQVEDLPEWMVGLKFISTRCGEAVLANTCRSKSPREDHLFSPHGGFISSFRCCLSAQSGSNVPVPNG